MAVAVTGDMGSQVLNTSLIAERPVYRPLPHPGRPNRWTRASVLDALCTWQTETGRAPRRADWSGERPERAGDAQRKWMREHPRWPSSSRTAALFGTWSTALREAALPARELTFPTTIAERVTAARALATEGLGLAAIAARLGVSRASAYNYLQARDCPDCGAPMTGPRASRCRECTRHEPTVPRAWTHAEARDAIREWTAEHGRPPSYREWTPRREHPGRWEAESPRWPSASVVCALFGDWNGALAEAGARPRLRRWDDDSIRAALSTFWAREGRRPSRADLTDPRWTGPSFQTVRRRFGGLDVAWNTLGPAP